MIIAYHIIGLSSWELGSFFSARAERDDVIERVRARYEQLRYAGILLPRCEIPASVDRPDRSTEEDDLAGDDRFVFLSVGERYSAGDLAPAAFGFVFDAEELVQAGALLGMWDLASEYGEIIGEAAEEIAAILPRLPRIADSELDDFMAVMQESDPGLRAAVAEGSTNPEPDLLRAIHDNNLSFPGCEQAMTEIRARIVDLHGRTRLQEQMALDYLRSHSVDGRAELLWSGPLPLSMAHGRVERGRVIMR